MFQNYDTGALWPNSPPVPPIAICCVGQYIHVSNGYLYVLPCGAKTFGVDAFNWEGSTEEELTSCSQHCDLEMLITLLITLKNCGRFYS